MFSLKTIKALLEEDTVSCEYFLRLHIGVEALLKRLLFIGLRLNNVQYKTAGEVVRRFYEKDRKKYFEVIWRLCGVNYDDIKKDGNYRLAEELYRHYTSVYRNGLVHGSRETISDPETLRTLILSDRLFINSILSYLKAQKDVSPFDPPSNWGAQRSGLQTVDAVYTSLFGSKTPLSHSTYNPENVSQLLAGIAQ